MSRYRSHNVLVTTLESDIYHDFLDERGLKVLTHHRTPIWTPMTDEMRNSFNKAARTWRLGDRFWKLANEFYGDSSLWWCIAWFNGKPTEAHMKAGDTVLIPVPVEEVLSLFNFGSR